MRRALVLAVALGMSGSAAAFADSDVPGADWMPEDQVIQKLGAAGYTNITGLHADDEQWEGKGVITEFEVNPRTGELLKEEVDRD